MPDPTTPILIDYSDHAHDTEDASESGFDVSGVQYIDAGVMKQSNPPNGSLLDTNLWADSWSGIGMTDHPSVEVFAKMIDSPPATGGTDFHPPFTGVSVRIRPAGSNDEAVVGGIWWEESPVFAYRVGLLNEPEAGHTAYEVIDYQELATNPTGPWWVWLKAVGTDYSLYYKEALGDPWVEVAAGSCTDAQRVSGAIGIAAWQMPQDASILEYYGGGLVEVPDPPDDSVAVKQMDLTNHPKRRILVRR